MGGVVNQFAQALVQMSHCKFLGHANYTIAKDTTGLFGGIFTVVTNTNAYGISPGLNKTNKFYNFYYGSTPISEWIGVIFQYVATNSSSNNSPAITFRIKSTSGAVLSKAVKFTFPAHLQMFRLRSANAMSSFELFTPVAYNCTDTPVVHNCIFCKTDVTSLDRTVTRRHRHTRHHSYFLVYQIVNFRQAGHIIDFVRIKHYFRSTSTVGSSFYRFSRDQRCWCLLLCHRGCQPCSS